MMQVQASPIHLLSGCSRGESSGGSSRPADSAIGPELTNAGFVFLSVVASRYLESEKRIKNMLNFWVQVANRFTLVNVADVVTGSLFRSKKRDTNVWRTH
jgi:hypothetical protein